MEGFKAQPENPEENLQENENEDRPATPQKIDPNDPLAKKMSKIQIDRKLGPQCSTLFNRLEQKQLGDSELMDFDFDDDESRLQSRLETAKKSRFAEGRTEPHEPGAKVLAYLGLSDAPGEPQAPQTPPGQASPGQPEHPTITIPAKPGMAPLKHDPLKHKATLDVIDRSNGKTVDDLLKQIPNYEKGDSKVSEWDALGLGGNDSKKHDNLKENPRDSEATELDKNSDEKKENAVVKTEDVIPEAPVEDTPARVEKQEDQTEEKGWFDKLKFW